MAASLIPEIESVKLAVSHHKQSLLEASGRRFVTCQPIFAHLAVRCR
jgi:hypothetical protein